MCGSIKQYVDGVVITNHNKDALGVFVQQEFGVLCIGFGLGFSTLFFPIRICYFLYVINNVANA